MRRWVWPAAVLVAVAAAGCSAPVRSPSGASPVASTTVPDTTGTTTPMATVSPSATPTASPATTPRPATSTAVVVRPVGDVDWARMVTTGVWRSGCPVGRDALRRVEVPFLGFDGRPHRGVLVVNRDVAGSVGRVFARLYAERFPIRRIVPVESYDGDDAASMRADNTSAFNCRRPGQANAPSTASPHANGRAIDVNPYENPWVDPRCGCFQPDSYYGHHRSGPGVVVRGGVAWRAFTREGWTWQDSATIDYQHFDTGYPSRPL